MTLSRAFKTSHKLATYGESLLILNNKFTILHIMFTRVSSPIVATNHSVLCNPFLNVLLARRLRPHTSPIYPIYVYKIVPFYEIQLSYQLDS